VAYCGGFLLEGRHAGFTASGVRIPPLSASTAVGSEGTLSGVRCSENTPLTKFGEFPFHALR
jgi:hypothetical protein